MLNKILQRLALAVFVGVTTVPALAQVYVTTAPPAPIVETRPVAPGSGYAWVPGHWRWNGNQYVWTRGHWGSPPAHYNGWVEGHWVQGSHGRWHWVEGHWR